MSDEVKHRTTKVATEAFKLVMSGSHHLTPAKMKAHLDDVMENPPSKPTITNVLQQMEADGILWQKDGGREGKYRRSQKINQLRKGELVASDEVNAEKLASDVSDKISDKVEGVILNEVTEKDWWYRTRKGVWEEKPDDI